MKTSATATIAAFGSIDEALTILRPVMHGIAEAVGSHCEVVLHDLSSGDLRHSIVAIENGQVTGRTVGGPSTNLGIDLLNDQSSDHNDFGYRGRTADGRELHSSSVYFRDTQGKFIAALCINVDVTPLKAAQSAIRSMLPASDADQPEKEIVAPHIRSILDEMVDDAIASIDKAPPLVDKADRMAVLRVLEARGAFRVKRAVDLVAKQMGISRVTAYAYLSEIRSE